jgi:hypothetical protein
MTSLLMIGCATPWSRADGSPEAIKMARRVEKALGGRRALKRHRYLHFEFVVEEQGREVLRRVHLWDRSTGRYRLTGVRRGTPYMVLLNLQSQLGQAYEGYGNEPLGDPRAAFERATADHLHDAYWLLSASQLLDRGGHLAIGEPWMIKGQSYPTLAQRFDPGLAPTVHDRFWFHLDEPSGRPMAWSFALKGAAPSEATTYLWTQWQRVGQVWLPICFESIGGERVIRIENLHSLDEVRDEVFARPD